MAIKTVKIDTVQAVLNEFSRWYVVTDYVKPNAGIIDDIKIKPENAGFDSSIEIKFKRGTSWKDIIHAVVKMNSNECWDVDEKTKTVTLWWD